MKENRSRRSKRGTEKTRGDREMAREQGRRKLIIVRPNSQMAECLTRPIQKMTCNSCSVFSAEAEVLAEYAR